VPVVFSYSLVRDRSANAVVGHYTLRDALEALLKGTGLSGGLSDKGVLTISPLQPGTSSYGEAILTTNTQKQQNIQTTRVGRPAGIAAFLASIAAAFTASAENAGIDRAPIEEVLVTAEKKSERAQDVPVPLTLVNAEALADTSQVLLRDYYASVPGLSVTPGLGANAAISIRGISTGGITNPTVAITVDDVPFSGSTVATAGTQVPDFDPGDLARIEVLRGPQGTLYGANSMGGLLKYVTVDPATDAFRGRVEGGTSGVQNGAQPGFNLRASANIPLSDTFAMRASGYTRQDPGYINNPILGLKGVDEAQAYGGRWSALWKPSADLSFKLSAQYQRIRTDGVSEAIVRPDLGDLQQNYIPGIGGHARTAQAYSAIVNYRHGILDLTSVTGYNINGYSNSEDFSSAYGGFTESLFGVNGVPVHEYGDVGKFTQELRLSLPIGPHLDWLVGGFFTHEVFADVQTIGAENSTTGQVVGESYYGSFPGSYMEYAGFTDLTYHITDQFDIQLGGRESHIKSTQEQELQYGVFVGPDPLITPAVESTANAFTYLVTPRYKLSTDLMVYARLASGYRPGGPNPAETGVPPTVSPDKTQNYELGMKADFLDHLLSLDASLYYIRWKDIQISLRNSQNFSYLANGGAAKSQGAELAMTLKPMTGLTLSAWATYNDAVLTEDFPANSKAYGVKGDRLPNSARFSGNFALEQSFPIPGWIDTTGFVGGQMSYMGDRLSIFMPTSQRQYFPGYAKTDLRTGVRSDAWTAQLYVNNVADRRGVLAGGLGYYEPTAFIYIQPRTFGLSLSKSF